MLNFWRGKADFTLCKFPSVLWTAVTSFSSIKFLLKQRSTQRNCRSLTHCATLLYKRPCSSLCEYKPAQILFYSPTSRNQYCSHIYSHWPYSQHRNCQLALQEGKKKHLVYWRTNKVPHICCTKDDLEFLTRKSHKTTAAPKLFKFLLFLLLILFMLICFCSSFP